MDGIAMETGPERGRRARAPRQPDGFDSPFKESMYAFFRRFVEFYFPLAHADIAWDEGFKALDTELRQIAGKKRRSPVRVDSLFEVRRLSGHKQLVLIHSEMQTTRDGRLAERMWRYNYRSFDARGLEVVSFAILGDASPSWRPDHYGWSLWGCEVGIRFPVVKLIDFAGREEELAASSNPFALITLAYLQTRKTVAEPALRRHWKMRIVRALYQQNYTAEEVRLLFRAIDWMMQLEPEQEIIFMTELEELEAESGMPYVTSVERIAMGRGRQEGLQEGLQAGRQEGRQEGLRAGRQEGRQEGLAFLLATQLACRFGQVPEWAALRLKAAAPEALERWGKRIFEAQSLEELLA